MNLNKYFCSIIAVVLVILAKQSNANERLLKLLVKEFDAKLLSRGEEFVSRHQPALEAIDDIKQQANDAEDKAMGKSDIDAVSAVKKGYMTSIASFGIALDRAFSAISGAGKVYPSDSLGAREIIKQGIADAKEDVDLAELVACQALGAATAIDGDAAKYGLKKAIEHVSFAGDAAKGGLDAVHVLAAQGLTSGVYASEQGLKAANEAVEATGLNIYANLLQSATYAFGGITKIEESDPEAEEEEGQLGNAIVGNNADATAAIQDVFKITDDAVNEMDDGPGLEALYLIHSSVISAIKKVATLTAGVHSLIGNAHAEERTVATMVIYEAVKDAQKDLVRATAFINQSLGAAMKLIKSKKFQLEEAMKTAKSGSDAANQLLESARFLSLRGLKNGEAAINSGITAAVEAVTTAASVAYAQYLAAANVAFDACKNSQSGSKVTGYF